MRPFSRLFVCVLLVSGCGSHAALDVKETSPRMNEKSVNVLQAGDVAAARMLSVFRLAGATKRAKTVPTVLPRAVYRRPSVPAAAPASSWDWDCVALRETGADWSMHGPSYSSALGVMNEAVRENASPSSAARILAGTASREEQIAVGESIVAKHGIHAWAWQTVEACR